MIMRQAHMIETDPDRIKNSNEFLIAQRIPAAPIAPARCPGGICSRSAAGRLAGELFDHRFHGSLFARHLVPRDPRLLLGSRNRNCFKA
jgi:hypothetical protein